MSVKDLKVADDFCEGKKKKSTMLSEGELEFLNVVRGIYHSANQEKDTVVVVNKIHDSSVLFRNYAPVIDILIRKGLVSIKTYDTLTVSDLEKELFEL